MSEKKKEQRKTINRGSFEVKDIAEKGLMHKINDIAFKVYIFKAKDLEIIILLSPKMNAFEALSKYKCMVKQSQLKIKANSIQIILISNEYFARIINNENRQIRESESSVISVVVFSRDEQ